MLRLVSSNSPVQLAEVLAAELRAWRDLHGPFAPVHVVVPHKAHSEWLMNELSERAGAVLNLHRVTPHALTRTGEDTGLTGRIYAAFQDEAWLEGADFVRKYLDGEPAGAEPTARARRRLLRALVLAQRTAALFRGYREESPEFPASQECPTWQRLLWERVTAEEPAEEPLPGCWRLFVFDVASPTRAFVQEVKRRAGAGCQVTVLARVPAPAEVSVHAPVLDEALATGAALRRLWREAGADESAPRVELPTGEGVLQCLQAELVTGPLAHAPLEGKSPNLRFVESPSIRRECEWVAADTWRAVQDGGLRFHEVAVVVPQALQEDYLPALGAAFAEAHKVPRIEWDGALTRQSRVARAARGLLDLPLGPLSRAEVVSLLRHPAVCGLYEEAEPAQWEAWLDAVGIFHGAHAEDHAGTYLEGSNAAHWDQGLRRLALGAFLAGERSGADGWFAPGNLLVEERTQSQHASVATLVRLARSLVADAHFLRRAVLPPAEWVTVLKDYLAVHLQPTTTGSLKERGTLLRTLEELSAFASADTPVPYEVVHALAVAALEGMTGQRLGQLGQGVVVGSPESLRGLPFKQVYVMGMEAGALPGRDRRDELDARPGPPRSRRLESSAAFVDLLSLASGGLVVSRLSKDPLTGEDRAASTLFHELREWTERRAGSKALAASFHVPVRLLRAHDAATDPSFAAVFPEAKAEAQALAWGEHARTVVGPFQESRDVPMTGPARTFLKGTVIPPAPPPSTRPRQVSLVNLRRFLECPVDGYARFALRMKPPGEDRAAMEDEPFELPFLESQSLVPAIVEEVMFSADRERFAGDDDALRAFVTAHQALRWKRLSARGRASLGALSDMGQENAAESLFHTARVVLELKDGVPPGTPDIFRMGRPESPTERGTLAPPLALSVHAGGQDWNVEVVGRTHLLLEDTSLVVQAVASMPNDRDKPTRTMKLYKRVLRNWLDHLALCAAGNSRDRTLVLAGRAKAIWIASTFRAPALSQSAAREVLQSFIAPLLSPPVGFRLPFDPLVKRWCVHKAPLAAAFSPTLPDAAKRRATLLKGIEAHYDPFRAKDRLARQAMRQVASLPDPDTAQLLSTCERLDQFLSRCTLVEAP